MALFNLYMKPINYVILQQCFKVINVWFAYIVPVLLRGVMFASRIDKWETDFYKCGFN